VVAFWGAAGLYGIFVFRLILRGNAVARARQGWPRGGRLLLFVLAIVLTVLLVIPAAILAVGYAFGMTDCPADFSPAQPWRCTPGGRFLFMTVGITLALPLAAAWLRWLLGVIYRSP
jgi:hypothetical protein